MKTAYLQYSMSVIVGRALPDVRDGLKPVHRRVLYAMSEMSNFNDKPYKKSARVVGDVIGKYHPHGDVAVYETMVRMAQDFSLRYPLVDGQGNFGSIDGDSAAAQRYTEVRMTKIAEYLIKDIDKETVDFAPNYDGSLQIPSLLPAKIPNLIINGSSGIAVGMATNIPPHNLNEVVDACVRLIDEPDLEISDLIKIIPGPDFPSAGLIAGRKGIVSAYNTGRGVITLKSKVDIETTKDGRDNIVISELPYQVNKAKLIETVASLVNDKKIEGISDIRDESSREGMRVVIKIKRNENSEVILNRLFKYTNFQVSYGIIMLALDAKGQPRVFNLKDVLNAFIDHRKEVITRRSIFELKKNIAREHLLQGLMKAISNIDEVINIIKTSKENKSARDALMLKYSFTIEQVKAILDIKLSRLTSLERQRLQDEITSVAEKISWLKSILADPKKILDLIKKEFAEVKAAFGDKRKTQIVERQEDLNEEDLVDNEDMLVFIY